MEMLNWLNANFYRKKPDKTIARRAIRHLKKLEKTQLFSPELSQMRAAEGRWYESLIYEMLLELTETTGKVKYVVRKGADAPFPPIEIKLGQNGIFYSNRGDINIRGNGQDIAEFDIVFVDYMDRICFCEIVTSASDLKDMEAEVHYKKKLLSYLYAQAVVPFVLFSSVDISRSSIMKRLMRETESTLIVTPTCEELKNVLHRENTKGVPRKPVDNNRLIGIEKIPIKRPFDYKMLHDMKRDRTLEIMMKGGGKEEMARPDGIPPVSKKVLFGALYPAAIRSLMHNRTYTMNSKKYVYDDMKNEFSKMVLAVDIPEYEPVIYLRSKKKNEYLKIVRKKSGELKVESKRTPQMTGFYLWLESLRPTLGSDVAQRYAEIFLDCAVETHKKGRNEASKDLKERQSGISEVADDAAENFRNNPNPSGRGCNTGRDYPESRGKTGRSKAVKNGIPGKNGKKDNGGNSGNNGNNGKSGKSGNMPRSKSRRRTGKPKQENRGSHERQEGAPVSAQAGAASGSSGAGTGNSPKVWGKAKKHVEGGVNSDNSESMPRHHGHHSKPRSSGRMNAYAARS
ncbi:MAG: hypothetical protein II893_05965 [Methanomicrobium sp.]|nr:hypothetical protein [Methanomicrobium sp.]